MKKFTAILLAVVMLFALSVSAFAAVNSKETDYAIGNGLGVSVDYDIEGMYFDGLDILSDADNGYYPFSFSLIASNRSKVASVTVSNGGSFHWAYAQNADGSYVTDEDGNYVESTTTNYGVVVLPTTSASTVTVTGTGNIGSATFNCAQPSGGTTAAGAALYAYLPAPAQFVNEGVTTGGWGDAYDSNGAVKATSSTGVSLGSFGGYVVLDFGTPAKDDDGNVTSGIYNEETNAYGVDFILYGNALSTWAEPGCVQVSPDGQKWYDIAGSLHYRKPAMTAATDTNGDTFAVSSAGAIWDYTATYTDPSPADQAITTAASNLGTSGKSPEFDFTAKVRPSDTTTYSGGSKVAYNAWHRHSWFPLTCNYFTDRTTADTDGDLRGNALANLTLAAKFGTQRDTTGNAMKLTFKGVRLMPTTNSHVGSTVPDDFLFGYADCHINGTPSGAQVNPYTTGRSTGGDPIDISWAVYPAGSTDSTGKDISGQPVSLTAIRYVRVYTGVQQMNGIMGESSTEITAAYTATTKGGSAASTTLTVTAGASESNLKAVTTANMGTQTVSIGKKSGFVKIVSSAEHIFVNGSEFTSGDTISFSGLSSTPNYVQIITQNGTEAPYITLLKVVR